ncbi:MAG TPA: exodeoxyribonuclease VII small subunit [Candidatus Brocadiia bacterium]|nr:exodeoxyribonuclease VII small subunit [Planctomycetota bacterium]MBI4007295.1 exodeoxyribonuclease VII small subunit [Planctomycetota bacterium]MDO8092862.1 exodeoxyribonuclease VII small subunit [Candidatus Brocadiales bacterium]
MAKIKFEESLKKLEGIVEQLERGDLTLDESLTKYENGIRLYKQCLALLESAEKKVQILTKNASGQFQTEDFLPPQADEG